MSTMLRTTLPNNEHWYNFEYGNAIFVVLNDIAGGVVYSPISGQNGDLMKSDSIDSFQKDFLNQSYDIYSDKTWKFAAHHRPLYSETSDLTHGGKFNQDLASWRGVFDAKGVNMVFNGHDHFYQRSMPLRNDMVVGNEQGTHYVVAAGAGATLYGTKDGSKVAYTAQAYHYTIVDVEDSDLYFKAKKTDGTVLDTMEIHK